MLSDAEVICAWMEPKPRDPICVVSAGGWWYSDWRARFDVRPEAEHLGALHLVEARLTEEQWRQYMSALHTAITGIHAYTNRDLIHASAEQKIRALAAILRPLVEKSHA